MYYISWMSTSKCQGILKLTKDPFYYGLGVYEDVEGEKWDICGVLPGYVQARRVSDFPNYYSTDGSYCSGLQTWHPYKVEVIDKEQENGKKENYSN